MTDTSAIKRLRGFSESHGVEWVKCSTDEWWDLQKRGQLQEAPFTSGLGIHWERKRLFYTSVNQWAECIHELGHLLATKLPPMKSTEWDFLGWEIAVVHHCKCSLDAWLESNRDYGVKSGDDMGDLPPVVLHRMLAERLSSAIEAGLVSQDCVPLVVR